MEFWKKTEAVNKVKIQAMSEVQKAVAEAEQKAFEVTATERARMKQTIADVKRQAAEDAFLLINKQEESTESCWNCGRKASETAVAATLHDTAALSASIKCPYKGPNTKPGQESTRKESHNLIFLMNTDIKIINKLSKLNPATY